MYRVIVLVPYNFKKSNGTKRSKYTSLLSKLRRYTACTRAEGYDNEVENEKLDQKDQRQGKNHHPDKHDDDGSRRK